MTRIEKHEQLISILEMINAKQREINIYLNTVQQCKELWLPEVVNTCESKIDWCEKVIARLENYYKNKLNHLK